MLEYLCSAGSLNQIWKITAGFALIYAMGPPDLEALGIKRSLSPCGPPENFAPLSTLGGSGYTFSMMKHVSYLIVSYYVLFVFSSSLCISCIAFILLSIIHQFSGGYSRGKEEKMLYLFSSWQILGKVDNQGLNERFVFHVVSSMYCLPCAVFLVLSSLYFLSCIIFLAIVFHVLSSS